MQNLVPKQTYEPDPRPGQDCYTKTFLNVVYDRLVISISNWHLWGCPTSKLIEIHNCLTSSNHLDVGVGSGYYLDNAVFKEPLKRLGLMDMNQNSLAHASKRVSRYNPTCYEVNILKPLNISMDPYDSISMNFLFHCLPGNLPYKFCALDHLLPFLRPGGCVFGSTVLGFSKKKGVIPTLVMTMYNYRGIYGNAGDSLMDLDVELKKRFHNYKIDVVGHVAIFQGIL